MTAVKKVTDTALERCKVAEISQQTQRDFPGGAEPGTPCSQCRGSGSDLCSGNQIPPPATKSLHAAAKDPTCPK